MRKLEIVQGLSDSPESQRQLQIVRAVVSLKEETTALRQDLQQLPPAVEEAVAQALEPLETLRQYAERAAQAIDEVLAIQRRTLDALAWEVSEQATKTIEQRLQTAQDTLSTLERTARKAASLIPPLEESTSSLIKAADRARHWVVALVILSVLSVVAAAIGPVVSKRLALPDDVQKKADFANALLSKATPKERELLRQIVSRPGP